VNGKGKINRLKNRANTLNLQQQRVNSELEGALQSGTEAWPA
jgi:hypothetical protein